MPTPRAPTAFYTPEILGMLAFILCFRDLISHFVVCDAHRCWGVSLTSGARPGALYIAPAPRPALSGRRRFEKRSCPEPKRSCRSSSSPRANYSENALILGAVLGDGARGPGGGASVAVSSVQLPPPTDNAPLFPVVPFSPPSRVPPTPPRVNYAGSSPALMGPCRRGNASPARSSTLGQGENVEATAKPGASLRWCWRL